MPNDAVSIPRELIEHLNRGDCVLFVGDTLDGAGSPRARLASALVDAADAHAECAITGCGSGARCAQPGACAFPLTYAAQIYERRNNRQALVTFVRRFLENPAPPSPIHRALAALPVRVMVTTAYDDPLKRALEKTGRPFLSVLRDVDVPYDDPARVQLVPLYGALGDPDTLVLTEDDAADLFARLPTVRTILEAHFASKTLLFAGYNLKDPYFHALYRQVTAPIARHQRLAYALQWPPNPVAADRWRGEIKLIEAEPLPFLLQLAQSMRVQSIETQRAVLPSEPYKFLDYFRREDAPIFFGRDLEADLLLSTILAHRLAVFYGRSGTGKTSLLLARVGPRLEEAGYRVTYARMLTEPVAAIKAAVRGVAPERLAYADQGTRLVDFMADALPPGGRMVVVLDQFEEFFVRQGDEVRRAFAQELAACLAPVADGRALDLRFVLSLRDDYLGALDELTTALREDVFAHRYRLENLTPEKALLAIRRPAEAFGLPIEEALEERLLADLEDRGLEPASLQIVLYRLYRDAVAQGLWSEKEKRGQGLTRARYDALGRTPEILAGYLDEVLNDLPDEGQR
ncbi:MAG: SIR2 family protein [Anaerolineae bacterium]